MSSAHFDALLRAAILKVLTEINDEHRDDLRDSMDPGDRKTVYHDGEKIGQVLRTAPEKRWTIIDHTKFGQWVGEHCPDALVVTTTINDSWKRAVLRRGKVEVIDPETGEVREETPDGIALMAPASQLQVRPNERAEGLALTLLDGLKEVTSGDRSE